MLIAYAQLTDHERLIDAQTTDARYHLARLVANGFAGGAQIIWDEHEQWRGAVLAPNQQTTPDLLSVGAAMWRRALAKGVIPPTSGAN